MKPAPSHKGVPTALLLTPKDENILRLFGKFRLLTAQEITHLCYSGWVGKTTPKTKDSVPTGSLTYARSRLSALSGHQDITDKSLTYGYPLWRVSFPTGKRGTNEKIFALSLTGRQMLEGLGIPVSWHMRPSRLRTFAHSTLLHDLTHNRFVVAMHAWAESSKPNLRIESHLSYELSQAPITVEIPVPSSRLVRGELVEIPVMTKVGVIPDGEIVITNTSTGERLLILLEIDHNTQAPERLRNHIAALLAYTKSLHFKRRYGNIPYRILYATQGVTDTASKSRLAYLCDFTLKLLTESKRTRDSQYFRFTTIEFARLYTDAKRLFDDAEPSWYLPGDVKQQSPVALFTEAKPQPQKE